jgi:ABC-type transport system substrate-binding protein
VPFNTWANDTYFLHNQSIYLVQLLPDYARPADYMLQIYPSREAVANGQNYAGFKNAQVDALLESWPTADAAEQTEDLLEVLKISQEELPYVPLWWEPLAFALNNKYVYSGTPTAVFYEQQWSNFISAAS